MTRMAARNCGYCHIDSNAAARTVSPALENCRPK
jgi:hypothetical protein